MGAPDPLYRWVTRGLLRLAAPEAGKELRPTQAAVGVRGGAELVVLALQHAARDDPHVVFADPDVANAYNTLDREAMFNAVDSYLPQGDVQLLLSIASRSM